MCLAENGPVIPCRGDDESQTNPDPSWKDTARITRIGSLHRFPGRRAARKTLTCRRDDERSSRGSGRVFSREHYRYVQTTPTTGDDTSMWRSRFRRELPCYTAGKDRTRCQGAENCPARERNIDKRSLLHADMDPIRAGAGKSASAVTQGSLGTQHSACIIPRSRYAARAGYNIIGKL